LGKMKTKKDGGDEDGVKFLISLKVLIIPNGPLDETALHLAARLGHIKMCTLLLEYNNECVNTPNNMKQTPLHLSAANKDLNMITLFLRHGALSSQDENGNAPLHLALQGKDKNKKKQNANVV